MSLLTASIKTSWTGMKPADLKKRLGQIARKAAKVGVLTSTNARDNTNLGFGSTGLDAGNADVGKANEFGSYTGWRAVSLDTQESISGDSIPERSFLRDPLTNHLADNLAEVGEVVAASFTSGAHPNLAASALGTAGVEVVQEAFDTGGYGQWMANSPQVAAWKGRDEPLVATGQLRAAIASETVSA